MFFCSDKKRSIEITYFWKVILKPASVHKHHCCVTLLYGIIFIQHLWRNILIISPLLLILAP